MRIAARLGGKEEPERTSVHRYRSVTGTGTPSTSLVSGSSFPFLSPFQIKTKPLSSRATQKKAGRPAAPFFLAASIENPSAASDQSQMRKRQWESCTRSERLFSTCTCPVRTISCCACLLDRERRPRRYRFVALSSKGALEKVLIRLYG